MAPKAKPDLSEFFALSRPKKKPCAIGFAREQLEAEEQVKLDAALGTDPGLITNGSIIEWLAGRGYTGINSSAVTSHRRKTCSCNG